MEATARAPDVPGSWEQSEFPQEPGRGQDSCGPGMLADLGS